MNLIIGGCLLMILLVYLRKFSDVETCSKPKDINSLFSQITQLGFNPYSITDWDAWLDHRLNTKNIEVAKHLLSTYPDRFKIPIDLFGEIGPCEVNKPDWLGLDHFFDVFWESATCKLEEYSKFVSEYVFPTMSLDHIQWKKNNLLSFQLRESPELVKVIDRYIAANS